MLTELKLISDSLEKVLNFLLSLEPNLKDNPLVQALQKAFDLLNQLGL